MDPQEQLGGGGLPSKHMPKFESNGGQICMPKMHIALEYCVARQSKLFVGRNSFIMFETVKLKVKYTMYPTESLRVKTAKSTIITSYLIPATYTIRQIMLLCMVWRTRYHKYARVGVNKGNRILIIIKIFNATNLCLRYAPAKCGKFDVSQCFFQFCYRYLEIWHLLFVPHRTYTNREGDKLFLHYRN